MLAPLSWLREFAPLRANVDELSRALSDLGLVVEGVAHVGGGLDGVVVARVAAIRPHPRADRIRLVDVDAGSQPDDTAEPGDTAVGDTAELQIACGASNFAVGDLVPLATVGTVLPSGMEISRRKMRGEWSNGMLCAADEVGLPEVEGERGLLILPAGLAAPGTPLVDALDLRPDVVFDIDVTPNRPDALSMVGIARDLAAALGETFTLPEPIGSVDDGVEDARVEVRDPDLCPRFTGTVVSGVPAGASPPWLARRLTLAGKRPINWVVDASNFVMLELGQPNHAYDLDKLPGRGLVVRRARPGETIVTLDGVERTMVAEDCLICDAEDHPVGIGGIMGGASSEIDATTTTVVLEAAWFSPTAITRTGKRLALTSEARSRFERGVDPEIASLAVDRFVTLLDGPRQGSRLDSPRQGATADVRFDAHLPSPPRLTLRTDRVNATLGTALEDDDVSRLLRPIGFRTEAAGTGVTNVTVPSWRPDAEREIDVIEEVARLYGYSRIARTLPPGVRTGGGLSRYQRERRRVRDVLAGAGLSEAWTTTFLGEGDLARAGLAPAAVEVENPLDRSESILRTSLLPGLLKAVRYNVDRQSPDVRLFEIGRVFLPPEGDAVLPAEREEVAIIVAGDGADARLAVRLWTVLADSLRLQGVGLAATTIAGLHPTRAALIQGPLIPGALIPEALIPGALIPGTQGLPVGAVGEVAPEVVSAYGLTGRIGYLSADLGALAGLPRRSSQARPVSRFPASDVDLAFVVPGDVPAAAVGATLATGGGDLLESLRLFDVYPLPELGPGTRSLAYRLRFRSAERTLTDAEVAAARKAAIDAVAAEHGASLRG